MLPLGWFSAHRGVKTEKLEGPGSHIWDPGLS